MVRNVLVALDGSEFSELSIPWAEAIARRAGARLHLVLVHVPLAGYSVDLAPARVLDSWEDSHRNREREYLEARAGELRRNGLDAVPEMLEGRPARRLIERAERDTDLVILTTHGRGGLERAWLGSVAEEVVHHVTGPVLLIRPDRDGEASIAPEPRHVLAATDGSPAAEAAVREAARLARLFGAQLTLLRVVDAPGGLTSPYLPHAAVADYETVRERDDEAERYLRDLAGRVPPGLHVRTRTFRSYHAARGIVNAAAELGADVVAVGTHRRTRLARAMLGSVADKVVRTAPVPVLVGHRQARNRKIPLGLKRPAIRRPRRNPRDGRR